MTVFTGKPGNGKLLSDDTLVLTNRGWKNHGDLCVGDHVVGLDGRFKRVTAVFPKDFADMKVTFSNGEVIYCHHNHEWVIEYHSGNTHKQRIMTAGKMFDRFQANDGYLIDEIVRRAVAKGGIITKTGRGSAPSYYTNSLLGLSSIDRFAMGRSGYMSETSIGAIDGSAITAVARDRRHTTLRKSMKRC